VTSVGSVTLAVTGSPAATNATKCAVGSGGSSCTVTFADSGFVIDLPNLLAVKPASGTIKAVKKDDATQACVPGFDGAVPRTVKFSATYANPFTGTKPVVLNTVSLTSTLADVAVSFDANASAPLSVRYDDAGQMTVNASFTGSGSEAGLVLTGSDQFVARPAALCVYSDTANSDCAASDASCSKFVRAGDSFRLRVRGAAWQSDADSDYCMGNGTTPNYQQSALALSSNLVAPAGGTAATLGVTSVDIVAADAGEKILTTQTVSEVGVFTLTATPPANYLGGPAVGDSDDNGSIDQPSRSVNIGRFYPASFQFDDPLLTPACSGGFTYAGLAAQVGPPTQAVKTGQPFTFTGALSARNVSGALTRNYISTFAKLTAADLTYADSAAISAGTVNVSSSSLTLPGVSGNGYLDYTANSPTLLMNSPIAPYSLKILTTATDIDTVTGNTVDVLTGTPLPDFRLGQARISNAHGSELQTLRLPITVGHFNGTGYGQNPLDSCTVFNTATLGAYQRVTGASPAAPVLLSYLNSAGTAAAPFVLSAGSSLLGGYLLSAPGAGNDGNVRLTYTTPSWLQFDWDGNGTLDPASALATFGIYQGATPMIFRREMYR
jgi:MSHA biogenesis protein MshQ